MLTLPRATLPEVGRAQAEFAKTNVATIAVADDVTRISRLFTTQFLFSGCPFFHEDINFR